MERRSFLKTIGAMAMTVIAPALAFAGFRRSRMVVNGVEMPFPKDGLNIAIELAGKETMRPIVVSVHGGILEIANPNGNAITVTVGKEAMVEVIGSEAGIIIEKQGAEQARETPFGILMTTYPKRGGFGIVGGKG